MPQFDYGIPGNPSPIQLTSEQLPSGATRWVVKKKKDVDSGNRPVTYTGDLYVEGGGGWQPSTPKSSDGGSSAGGGGGGGGGGAGRGGRNRNRGRGQQGAGRGDYNPLTAPFLTPRQLREEAARLAAMSVASEESLRQLQAQEEASLRGIGTALTERLAGYTQEAQAGMLGLGNLYRDIAGAAQTAGESTLAAAGVAPGEIPVIGGDALVAGRLAGIGGALAGYVPAAATTSARMVGESQRSLGQALTERANKVSEATARYLTQLQEREIDRALAQQAAEQNAARLGFQYQQEAWNQQVDQARLANESQRIAQSQQRIELSALNAIEAAGADKRKAIRSAKTDILKNKQDWLYSTGTGGGGTYKVRIDRGTVGGGRVDTEYVDANSVDEAIRKLQQQFPQTYGPLPAAQFVVTLDEARETTTRRNDEAVLRDLVPILRTAGMSRAQAVRWVNANILGRSGSGATTAPAVGPMGANR